MDLEERAFRLGLLRDWKSAGLVDAGAAGKIAADIGPPPERAAWPLRLVLFGFTALCFSALVTLILMNTSDGIFVGVVCVVAAGACVAGAELLLRRFAFYRHGVEEALVAEAIVLFAVGAGWIAHSGRLWERTDSLMPMLFFAGSALAYARYGYRLAAAGVVLSLGLCVESFGAGERVTRVLLAALWALLLAAISLARGLPRRERERLEIARFFLALSIPLVLNLRLVRHFDFFSTSAPWNMDAFAWFTLAAIFLIPAAVFAWGVFSRARALMWAGAIGLIVAQGSVKPYLQIERHSWDPALLGIELIAAALLLKRRLDAGPGRRRGAYSSEELGNSKGDGALGLLAGLIAAAPAEAPRGPDVPQGKGGSFGGGGATGSF